MLRDLFNLLMIAAHALLVFDVEENANELIGEIRMKIRTGVIIALLLAAIAVVGFGALNTSTAVGCGGGSSSGCSHETATQKEVQKPISLHDESLLISDLLEVLKQHFVLQTNLEDRDQYQAEIMSHLTLLTGLQQLVDRFAARTEQSTRREQSTANSSQDRNEPSGHVH